MVVSGTFWMVGIWVVALWIVVLGSVWVFRNNALRRANEIHAQEQEHFLRCVFDAVPHVLFAKDKEGRFFMVNKAMADLHGTTVSEMIGKTDIDFPGEKVDGRIDKVHEMDRKVIEEGRVLTWDGMDFIDRNGRKRIFQVSKHPIWLPWVREQGLVGISVDITDQKLVEKALRDQQFILQTIIDTLPDRIFVKDMEHRIILCNRETARYHGFESPEEMKWTRDRDLFPLEVARECERDEKRVMGGEELREIEETIPDAGGGETICLTSKLPLRSTDGTVTGLVGIARDITKLKKAEERQRFEQIRTREIEVVRDLVVTLQHEINTSLTRITGSTQFLAIQDDQMPADFMEMLRDIEAAAEQITDVVAKLSTLQHIDRVNYLGDDARMINVRSSREGSGGEGS